MICNSLELTVSRIRSLLREYVVTDLPVVQLSDNLLRSL